MLWDGRPDAEGRNRARWCADGTADRRYGTTWPTLWDGRPTLWDGMGRQTDAMWRQTCAEGRNRATWCAMGRQTDAMGRQTYFYGTTDRLLCEGRPALRDAAIGRHMLFLAPETNFHLSRHGDVSQSNAVSGTDSEWRCGHFYTLRHTTPSSGAVP